MGAFKFADTINASFVLVCGNIIRHIYIPPGAVIVDAVPGVVGQRTVIGRAVYDVAGDVLATAEGGEEIGKIIADTFTGAQCFTNIEILDKCVVIIVILEVLYDPFVDYFDLFFVCFTAYTNFVSKFFRLRIPQSCTAVGETRGIRFADETVCGDPCDQNESRYC